MSNAKKNAAEAAAVTGGGGVLGALYNYATTPLAQEKMVKGLVRFNDGSSNWQNVPTGKILNEAAIQASHAAAPRDIMIGLGVGALTYAGTKLHSALGKQWRK
jgi:hypothetical protein